MKKHTGVISGGLMAAATRVLLFASLLMPYGIAGSGKDSEDVYWTPSQIPSLLIPQYRAIGDRLQKPGKERIAIAGTLTDAFGNSNQIRVILEKGGKARIDWSSRSVRFNGEKSSSSDVQDQGLLESLVDDLADTFIEDAARGYSIRLVGQRYRNARGEEHDFYDAIFTGKVKKDAPAVKRYSFDSRTKLLSWVQYRDNGGRGGPIIETHFDEWVSVQGQAVPGSITRLKDGAIIFTLKVQGVDVSAKVDDGMFNP